MLLLAVLSAISVASVVYEHAGWDFLDGTLLEGAPSALIGISMPLASMLFVSVLLMVLTVEGGVMVADAFRKHRVDRAREEGREEGLERGRAEEREQWSQWLARKETAEREGRPFDEPPPGGE